MTAGTATVGFTAIDLYEKMLGERAVHRAQAEGFGARGGTET